MKIYTYDIWDGDKGIIFANSMKEATKLFKEAYPDTKIADYDCRSGECFITQFVEAPTEPRLLFMYD